MADIVPELVQEALAALARNPSGFTAHGQVRGVFDPHVHAIYDYIINYDLKHGKGPSWTKIKAEFKNKFELGNQLRTKKKPSELIDELIHFEKVLRIQGVFNFTTAQKITEWDQLTEPLAADLLREMRDCVTAASMVGAIDSDKVIPFGGGPDLKQNYNDLVSGIAAGIPLPFSELSDPFNGLQAGYAYGLFGAPGAKKTFILAYFAAHFALLENKTFLFSSEMDTLDLKRRIAAMIAGINYDEVSKGTLSAADQMKYYDWLESPEHETLNKYLIIGGPTSCGSILDVEHVVTEHQIDIVCLDTIVNLANPNQYGNIEHTEVQTLMKNLNTILKRHKIPCLYTSHFNRSGGKQRAAVAHGDGFAKWSAQMWSVAAKDETFIDFSTFKARESSDTGKKVHRYEFDLLTPSFKFFATMEKGKASAVSTMVTGFSGR